MNTRPFFLHASLRLPLCSLLLAIGAALPASAQNADPLVVLQSHEQRPWSLPADLERIAIANPDVADVVTLKKRGEVLLVGKSPGTTTLLLWQRGKSEPQRIQVDVRSAVQDALLGPGASAVTVQDGQALLAGSTESLLLHDQARKAATAATAATAGKGTINDVSTISSGGMVQVEVRVVEFNKTTLKQLGLQFSNGNGGFSYGFATTGAASLPGADTGTTSALSSAFNLVAKSVPGNWNANLNLLASNGMARVLAEPTLVALSGQSASFLAGGELPILEPQGLGTTTITYKPFGIGLTVTPTVLAPDRIALKVAPEASDLDWNNGIVLNGTQVPAISTRRADTTVELGDGESFVIGGLISSQVNSTVNKIPLLGDLPIIGSFFRNLDYQRQDKELVIVVTPRLVRPLARGTEITLPGERESQPKLPVWGAWLLHPAGSDALPGFSR